MYTVWRSMCRWFMAMERPGCSTWLIGAAVHEQRYLRPLFRLIMRGLFVIRQHPAFGSAGCQQQSCHLASTADGIACATPPCKLSYTKSAECKCDRLRNGGSALLGRKGLAGREQWRLLDEITIRRLPSGCRS